MQRSTPKRVPLAALQANVLSGDTPQKPFVAPTKTSTATKPAAPRPTKTANPRSAKATAKSPWCNPMGTKRSALKRPNPGNLPKRHPPGSATAAAAATAGEAPRAKRAAGSLHRPSRLSVQTTAMDPLPQPSAAALQLDPSPQPQTAPGQKHEQCFTANPAAEAAAAVEVGAAFKVVLTAGAALAANDCLPQLPRIRTGVPFTNFVSNPAFEGTPEPASPRPTPSGAFRLRPSPSPVAAMPMGLCLQEALARSTADGLAAESPTIGMLLDYGADAAETPALQGGLGSAADVYDLPSDFSFKMAADLPSNPPAYQDATPGLILDDALDTPSAERSVQAWFWADSPCKSTAAGPLQPLSAASAEAAMGTPQIQQLLSEMRIATPAALAAAAGVGTSALLGQLQRTLPEASPMSDCGAAATASAGQITFVGTEAGTFVSSPLESIDSCSPALPAQAGKMVAEVVITPASLAKSAGESVCSAARGIACIDTTSGEGGAPLVRLVSPVNARAPPALELPNQAASLAGAAEGDCDTPVMQRTVTMPPSFGTGSPEVPDHTAEEQQAASPDGSAASTTPFQLMMQHLLQAGAHAASPLPATACASQLEAGVATPAAVQPTGLQPGAGSELCGGSPSKTPALPASVALRWAGRGGMGSPATPAECVRLMAALEAAMSADADGAASPGGQGLGEGSLEGWLLQRGLLDAISSPAHRDLQAMWAAAAEAAELRALVERVKASELEIAAAEAADAQSHWDHVLAQSAALEAENAALRCEVAALQLALRLAAAAKAAAVERTEATKQLASEETLRAATAAGKMLEHAHGAVDISAAYEAEKTALLEEVAAVQARLGRAQAGCRAAKVEARAATADVAELERLLLHTRHRLEYAKSAAATERLALQSELVDARHHLAAVQAAMIAADAAKDAAITGLYTQLKAAHEEIYELHQDGSSSAEAKALQERLAAEQSSALATVLATAHVDFAAARQHFEAGRCAQEATLKLALAQEVAQAKCVHEELTKAQEAAQVVEQLRRRENELLLAGLIAAHQQLAAAAAVPLPDSPIKLWPAQHCTLDMHKAAPPQQCSDAEEQPVWVLLAVVGGGIDEPCGVQLVWGFHGESELLDLSCSPPERALPECASPEPQSSGLSGYASAVSRMASPAAAADDGKVQQFTITVAAAMDTHQVGSNHSAAVSVASLSASGAGAGAADSGGGGGADDSSSQGSSGGAQAGWAAVNGTISPAASSGGDDDDDVGRRCGNFALSSQPASPLTPSRIAAGQMEQASPTVQDATHGSQSDADSPAMVSCTPASLQGTLDSPEASGWPRCGTPYTPATSSTADMGSGFGAGSPAGFSSASAATGSGFASGSTSTSNVSNPAAVSETASPAAKPSPAYSMATAAVPTNSSGAASPPPEPPTPTEAEAASPGEIVRQGGVAAAVRRFDAVRPLPASAAAAGAGAVAVMPPGFYPPAAHSFAAPTAIARGQTGATHNPLPTEVVATASTATLQVAAAVPNVAGGSDWGSIAGRLRKLRADLQETQQRLLRAEQLTFATPTPEGRTPLRSPYTATPVLSKPLAALAQASSPQPLQDASGQQLEWVATPKPTAKPPRPLVSIVEVPEEEGTSSSSAVASPAALACITNAASPAARQQGQCSTMPLRTSPAALPPLAARKLPAMRANPLADSSSDDSGSERDDRAMKTPAANVRLQRFASDENQAPAANGAGAARVRFRYPAAARLESESPDVLATHRRALRARRLVHQRVADPSASEEREFRRRAAALQIRISPYFKRR